MISSKDTISLEEAYLSIAKKVPSVPSDDKEEMSVEPNEIVSSGPMTEPAPGTDTEMISPEAELSPVGEVPESPLGGVPSPALEDPRLEVEDEDQEDDIAISNLNSIRESIVKIAEFCASGKHLEPWQQQKLSIAMDSLADVARRMK